MKHAKTKLKEALQLLVDTEGDADQEDAGLCYYIEAELGLGHRHLLQTYFAHWEGFSGSDEYPVPASYVGVDEIPETAARRAWEAALWEHTMYAEEYGQHRLALARFIIKELTKEGY